MCLRNKARSDSLCGFPLGESGQGLFSSLPETGIYTGNLPSHVNSLSSQSRFREDNREVADGSWLDVCLSECLDSIQADHGLGTHSHAFRLLAHTQFNDWKHMKAVGKHVFFIISLKDSTICHRRLRTKQRLFSYFVLHFLLLGGNISRTVGSWAYF